VASPADISNEARDARRILDAATTELVGMLARRIAFSPEPAAALGPCRAAVIGAIGAHLQNLAPAERDWLIEYVMDRVLASALEILSLGHVSPAEPDHAAPRPGRR